MGEMILDYPKNPEEIVVRASPDDQLAQVRLDPIGNHTQEATLPRGSLEIGSVPERCRHDYLC